ncbi:MAG: iron-sulfur cluster assembly scaffold protein [Marinicaulis sp.]|nr:iron-sulfur cluster assembly scaffold protein [Marinicaulis sp.]
MLGAAADIPASRRLDAPDATATKVSRICGSEVTVDIKVESDRIEDFAMIAKACALGQAAASIVARNIVGARLGEFFELRDQMRAMLKDGGPPPTGERWKDLAVLETVRDYPQRHTSTLLVFEAVCDCLDQINGR